MVPDQNQYCISNIESSIKNLIKNWNTRQKWINNIFLINPETQTINNQRAPWRKKLSKFLESTPVRAATIFLLVLDLVLTVLELSSSLLSTNNCSSSSTRSEKRYLLWWHWLGIGILSILSTKAVAECVGLGTDFLDGRVMLWTGVVVIGALFLEAFLEKKGGGLLVVVSLWRVVRVVESAFELSDEAIEAQIQQIVCQFEILREENSRLLAQIDEKDVMIHNLEEMIHNLQSSSSSHNQCSRV